MVDKLIKLIKEIQFVHCGQTVFSPQLGQYKIRQCPICYSSEEFGHKKDCKIKKILDDYEKK